MKWTAFLLFSCLTAMTVCVEAQDTPKKSPPKLNKSQFNTQVYEQNSEEASFEATVKVTREVQGDMEVFFEGKQGFYSVAPGASQNLLVKSQQKHTPVKVVVNPTARQILKVEAGD